MIGFQTSTWCSASCRLPARRWTDRCRAGGRCAGRGPPAFERLEPGEQPPVPYIMAVGGSTRSCRPQTVPATLFMPCSPSGRRVRRNKARPGPAPDSSIARVLVAVACWALSALGAAAQGGVESDRAALEAFYDATGGAGWTDSTNWKTSAPLGEWHGVTTDTAGRVTRLELQDNGLVGSIPPALGSLTNLLWLQLGSNALTGPIPDALGSLASLQLLFLYRNDLTGPLPAWEPDRASVAPRLRQRPDRADPGRPGEPGASAVAVRGRERVDRPGPGVVGEPGPPPAAGALPYRVDRSVAGSPGTAAGPRDAAPVLCLGVR